DYFILIWILILTLASNAMSVQVDFQRACADQSRRLHLALRAAQNGAYTGDQFAWGKGLYDVIISPDFQPNQPIHLLCARGEHNDRHAGFATQCPRHINTIHTREIEVEDNEVGLLLTSRGQRA